ncbi:MAG TPA: glutamine synthetase adenylyltransferase, partial [Nitrospiria bacterium]|nr:glutamine synthetase adenylyltransferase [Nitrospiria bacterium]
MPSLQTARREIEKKTTGIPSEIREEFFARMDPDYFERHTAGEIAKHLSMIGSVDLPRPISLDVQPLGEDRYLLTLAGFDFFSEFAIFCGMIASSGFDIEAGEVYTYADRGFPGGKRIIDLFWVRDLKRLPFDEERQKEFLASLLPLVLLLEEGKYQEARVEVNRRWVEQLSQLRQEGPGLLYPIEIRFDNRSLDRWTVMEIRSADAPGFLYALANALSLRNLYIKRVEIESRENVVRDRFTLRDRRGKKLSGQEQASLRIAVALIKQFMRYLIQAPNPALALNHFDLLIDRVLQEKSQQRMISFLGRGETLDLLARLLGASEFLWEDFLRMQTENLLPVLKTFRSGRSSKKGREVLRQALRKEMAKSETFAERKFRLNRFKDREIFRTDMAHLVDPNENLIRFSADLTDLAEAVLEEAYRACRRELEGRHGSPRSESGKIVPLTLLGLGKFGGREMGYASDIELLPVYGSPGRTDGRRPVDNRVFFEELVGELLKFVEAKRDGIFQIDLRLRPFGSKGSLASPFASFASYFSPEGAAAPFERQALIKLRWAAGDRALGKKAEAHRDRFVYGGAPWDLAAALHLRERQIRELVPAGKINAKYSPGGIIDIEYAVQYLQIENGAALPSIRTPSTLKGLEHLAAVRLLRAEERDRLRESYLFLRRLIDALRIVRGNAKDLLLPDFDSEEFTFLARRLGYLEAPWKKGRERLRKEIEKQMGYARDFFERRFVGK